MSEAQLQPVHEWTASIEDRQSGRTIFERKSRHEDPSEALLQVFSATWNEFDDPSGMYSHNRWYIPGIVFALLGGLEQWQKMADLGCPLPGPDRREGIVEDFGLTIEETENGHKIPGRDTLEFNLNSKERLVFEHVIVER